jgi:UDP-N-acetylmuramate: L-alanyl-gamma-D-glutamyl-meso-diaminopimelate ligase
MKLGAMASRLPTSLACADLVFCYAPDQGKHALGWNAHNVLAPLSDSGKPVQIVDAIDALVTAIAQAAKSGDQIVIMSNGGFGGIHDKLLAAIRQVP